MSLNSNFTPESAVDTLWNLAKQYNDNNPIESKKGQQIPKDIYLRAVPDSKNQNQTLEFEKGGGFFHWIKRLFTANTYCITKIDGNEVKNAAAGTVLLELHQTLEKISEDQLASILEKLDITDKAAPDKIKKFIPILNRFLDRVKEKKEATTKNSDLRVKIHQAFESFKLGFKNEIIPTQPTSPSSVASPPVASQKEHHDAALGNVRSQISENLQIVTEQYVLADQTAKLGPTNFQEAKKAADTIEGVLTTISQIVQQNDELLRKAKEQFGATSIDGALEEPITAMKEKLEIVSLLKVASLAKMATLGHQEDSKAFLEAQIDELTKMKQSASELGRKAELAIEKNDLPAAQAAESESHQLTEVAKEILKAIDAQINPDRFPNEKELFAKLLTEVQDIAKDINRHATDAHTAKEKIQLTLASQAITEPVDQEIEVPAAADPSDSVEVASGTKRAPPSAVQLREKPLVSAKSLIALPWLREYLSSDFEKLENGIKHLQKLQAQLAVEEEKVNILVVNDDSNARTRDTALREIGLCQKALSVEVDKLQRLMNPKNMTDRVPNARTIKSNLNALINFRPDAFANCQRALTDLSTKIDSPLSEVNIVDAKNSDDFLALCGNEGKALAGELRLLARCEVFLPNNSPFKAQIKGIFDRVNTHFDMYKADAQTLEQAKADINSLRSSVEQIKVAGIANVLSEFTDALSYMAALDIAILQCPDELADLRDLLRSCANDFVVFGRGLFIGRKLRLDSLKETHRDRLITYFLDSHKDHKKYICSDRVKPEHAKVAQFVKQLIYGRANVLVHDKPVADMKVAESEALRSEAAPLVVTMAESDVRPSFASLQERHDVAISRTVGVEIATLNRADTLKKINSKIEIFKATFEKLEEQVKSGWFWNSVGETEFGKSNSGSLSRGAYVALYNKLDQLPTDYSDNQFDQLGRQLNYADYLLIAQGKVIVKDQAIQALANRVVAFVMLQEMCKKTELFLQSANLNTADNVAFIKKMYEILGLRSADPANELLLDDQLLSLTDKGLATAMNNILTLIEGAKWNEQWGSMIEVAQPGTENVLKAKAYSDLKQELMAYVEGLKFS